MKNLDNLYEAYQNYKKLCIVDNETPRFLRAYMNVKDRESEDIQTVFSVCHIEQDWVEAIEVGLPFIEKAIKEERQFIRNDGEVLPIEKIRKTSKASIQDLAKHANYITHEAPEDAETEVLPDKMLMIQKESDFAIYENRVLYAALMYLKDFVTSRLVEIKETTNTYIVKQHINKMIDMGARKIKIDLKFDESHVNDPLLTEKNQEKEVIDRLDEILTGILALLKTPLMREVSKVEMVSRPIAKTNILKMNRNFRESLACFEYIANYQGKGFTIEHIEKSLIPYSKLMNEAYTENLIMLSFINYMFANNIQQELKDDYDAIIAKRELQRQNEILAKLREFHATAEEKEQTINEFLIMFEQGYRILEERNDELNIKVKENEIRRQKELKEQQEAHEEYVAILNKGHQEEINNLNIQNDARIANIQQECADKISEIEVAKNDEINNIRQEATNQINETKQTSATELETYKAQFKEHIEQMERENAELKEHFQEQNERIANLEAELLSRRIANGETNEKEYTMEERFNALEKLKADFDRFFNKAWKEAKKQIRKDILARKKKNKKEKGEVTEPVFAEENNNNVETSKVTEKELKEQEKQASTFTLDNPEPEVVEEEKEEERERKFFDDDELEELNNEPTKDEDLIFPKVEILQPEPAKEEIVEEQIEPENSGDLIDDQEDLDNQEVIDDEEQVDSEDYIDDRDELNDESSIEDNEESDNEEDFVDDQEEPKEDDEQ